MRGSLAFFWMVSCVCVVVDMSHYTRNVVCVAVLKKKLSRIPDQIQDRSGFLQTIRQAQQSMLWSILKRFLVINRM